MSIEVGAGISKGLAAQLEARKKVIGKTSGRTDDDLMYMNSKTGWVKLSSGVNTLSDEEVAQFRRQEGRGTIKGGNSLASENVLLGGILKPGAGLREGIDTTGNVESNRAYLLRPSTGFRPMAGITSMTVKSKNTYGTLREAEVSFSVWSLEEFEVMERLYLRPGFTMLLEWGHSLYIDNSGALQKTIKTVSPKLFFRSNVKMSELTDEIAKIRLESDYNYEGMVGSCKNFSWSYNSNGGYDCTVSLVSTGELIESAPAAIPPSKLIGNMSEFESRDSEEGKEQRKSIYHYLFSKLTTLTSSPINSGQLSGANAATLAAGLPDFTAAYADVQMDDGFFFDTDTPMHWIPLGVLLEVYNKFGTIKDLTKEANSADYSITKFNTDIKKASKFLTGPKHFSVDPTICVLPNPNDEGLGVVSAIHGGSFTYTDPESVLSIWVSIPFLKQKFDEAIDTDNKFNKSFSDILKSILDGVNTALGGINDLDIYYDEEDRGGTFHVIDRNVTATSNKPPELTLVGVDSIFREIGISSKISNETSSQIAIAAQGTTQNYTDNVENILKWNPNIIDRVRPTKDTSTKNKDGEDAVKQDQEETLAEWKESVKEVFTKFEASDGYKPEDLQALKTEHAEYTVENTVRRPGSGTDAAPGIIPVELSLKLDGVGGFKVASTFRISSGILPDKYNDKFGYIITGVEHSIGTNNVWETSVTTQFYLLAQLQQETRQPQIINPAPSPSPAAVGAAGYTPPGPINPGDDPAPVINSKRVGAVAYGASPVAKNSQANGGRNGLLDQKNPKLLVFIGETSGAKSYYTNPATGRPEYMLHPAAARAWQAWKADMKAQGVKYAISSAYRSQVHQAGLGSGKTVASPGSSPHGWGGALDFSNLYQIVNGSGDPKRNLNARKTDAYKKIATLGAKHGWYNPWRLSDVNGTDELWHFEYWGPV